MPHIFGSEPRLIGARLDALFFESFIADGEVVSPINVVYFKVKGAWSRLVLDAGTVHWRVQDSEPKSWASPQEGWEYPVRDAGSSYGLVGAEICDTRTLDTPGGIRFEVAFKDGRRAIFQNYLDYTSFELLPGGKS